MVPLAAGGAHTCIIVSSDEVRCWGANNQGQLGLGRVSPYELPAVVPGLLAVVQIAAGGDQTCALKAAGDVWCWGAAQVSPVRIAGRSDVKELAVGGLHACAVHDDGTLSCWGSNHEGQLGDGSKKDRADPVPVALPWAASGIAIGPYTSCAFSSALGEIACWGMHFDIGSKGLIGPFLPAPQVVRKIEGVAQLAVGFHHVCARTQSGAVSCWGDNRSGQFVDPHPTAGATTPIAGLDDAIDLRAANRETCAIRRGGAVVCFGGEWLLHRRTGLLGEFPIAGADALAVGGAHGCLRRGDGSVACWGANAVRQIGDGTPETREAPAVVLAPGAAPPSPTENGVGDSCASDVDCTWDDACAPTRCASVPSSRPARSCAATLPAPGSCVCLHTRCLLHPWAAPPPPPQACRYDTCGLDEGKGRCLVGRGTATNPTSAITEGPFCRCDAQSHCVFEWVTPAPCHSDNDCWISTGAGPARAIRRPPDLHRRFSPCHDGETAPVCRHGVCGFGLVYPC